MERLAIAYVHLAADDPSRYQVMFGAGLDKAAHPLLLEAGQASFQAWADAVSAAQQSGALPSGDTYEIAFPAWALVHGIASLLTSGTLGPAEATPEQLTSHAIRTFLAGVAKT